MGLEDLFFKLRDREPAAPEWTQRAPWTTFLQAQWDLLADPGCGLAGIHPKPGGRR